MLIGTRRSRDNGMKQSTLGVRRSKVKVTQGHRFGQLVEASFSTNVRYSRFSRELMGRVAKLKLQYFGHITRESAVQLALTVLEGIMEGLRHQGRGIRQWIHDIEEWTGCEYIQLKEMSQDQAQWRRKISEWSSAVANPHRGRSSSE